MIILKKNLTKIPNFKTFYNFIDLANNIIVIHGFKCEDYIYKKGDKLWDLYYG